MAGIQTNAVVYFETDYKNYDYINESVYLPYSNADECEEELWKVCEMYRKFGRIAQWPSAVDC